MPLKVFLILRCSRRGISTRAAARPADLPRIPRHRSCRRDPSAFPDRPLSARRSRFVTAEQIRRGNFVMRGPTLSRLSQGRPWIVHLLHAEATVRRPQGRGPLGSAHAIRLALPFRGNASKPISARDQWQVPVAFQLSTVQSASVVARACIRAGVAVTAMTHWDGEACGGASINVRPKGRSTPAV